MQAIECQVAELLTRSHKRTVWTAHMDAVLRRVYRASRRLVEALDGCQAELPEVNRTAIRDRGRYLRLPVGSEPVAQVVAVKPRPVPSPEGLRCYQCASLFLSKNYDGDDLVCGICGSTNYRS